MKKFSLKKYKQEKIVLAWKPGSKDVLFGTDCRHVKIIGTNFDDHARAIYFPKKDVLYFRFFKPNGDYFFISEEDKVRSFETCWTMWERLIARGFIDRETLVLFWEANEYDKTVPENRRISHNDIKW